MAKEPMSRGKDKQGRGVWLIQVNTGVCIDGKYQRINEVYHGTRKAARARQREIEAEIDAGVNVTGGKMAFDRYAQEWLGIKKLSVAPRTFRQYEAEAKRLIGILGSTPLCKINAPVVRSTLQAAREGMRGRNGGKPSENSVKATYRVLSMILGQAAKDDLIRVNPCTKVDAPRERGNVKERRSLTFEQYADFLKKLDACTQAAYSAFEAKEAHLVETGHQNKPRNQIRGIREASNLCAARIALATGARPSEIFALEWRHVDFPNACIHIEQATETENGGKKENKSDAGKRDIYLNAHTLEALAEWRRFQFSAANKLGIELGMNSWVACSDAFTQIKHANFTHWWRSWVDSIGFGGWQLYELRHTQATLLISAGANLHSVKTQMGHSDLRTTMIYTHTDEVTQRKLAELLPTV